jgi:hypothetical protein
MVPPLNVAFRGVARKAKGYKFLDASRASTGIEGY